MGTLIHADIFFFITSISVIIFTFIWIIIGYYLIKVMKNFAEISEKLKKVADTADDELKEITEQVRESTVFSFIFGKKKGQHHTKK